MDLDIRVKVSFKDHRKRKKLAARLGPAGVLALLDLWLSAAQTHPGGRLAGYTAEDIELDAGWTGDAGAFARVAEECGWLDRDGDGYRLHDWPEHQGWLVHAPERSACARQAAEARWTRQQNARRMRSASEAHAEGNAPSPSPDPAPTPDPDEAAMPPVRTPGVGVAPERPPRRNGIAFDYDAGTLVGVTDQDRQEWGTAYPAVTVDLELLRASQWLRDNPTKRKKNVRRFLTNWLARQQERGGSPALNRLGGSAGMAIGQKVHENTPLEWR